MCGSIYSSSVPRETWSVSRYLLHFTYPLGLVVFILTRSCTVNFPHANSEDPDQTAPRSGSSLFTDTFYEIFILCRQKAKNLTWTCGCTGCPGLSMLVYGGTKCCLTNDSHHLCFHMWAILQDKRLFRLSVESVFQWLPNRIVRPRLVLWLKLSLGLLLKWVNSIGSGKTAWLRRLPEPLVFAYALTAVFPWHRSYVSKYKLEY